MGTAGSSRTGFSNRVRKKAWESGQPNKSTEQIACGQSTGNVNREHKGSRDEQRTRGQFGREAEKHQGWLAEVPDRAGYRQGYEPDRRGDGGKRRRPVGTRQAAK